MKNKTLATWLAFLGGPLGLHRFYLFGFGDLWGWLLPVPTVLGLYGVTRIVQFGVDDVASWWLVPLLGFVIAACCLNAIVYGLMTREKWNAKFGQSEDADAGGTSWITIFAVVASLMIGGGVLMATLAYSFYNYFNNQIEEGRRISE